MHSVFLYYYLPPLRATALFSATKTRLTDTGGAESRCLVHLEFSPPLTDLTQLLTPLGPA